MRNTTDKTTLAASIADALEDGSYETLAASDNGKVAYIRIAGADATPTGWSYQTAQANGAATLRSAGINAHHLYGHATGWHIKATAWA